MRYFVATVGIVFGMIIFIVILFSPLMYLEAVAKASACRKMTGRSDVTAWDMLWVDCHIVAIENNR